jgi:hypothetical protein
MLSVSLRETGELNMNMSSSYLPSTTRCFPTRIILLLPFIDILLLNISCMHATWKYQEHVVATFSTNKI